MWKFPLALVGGTQEVEMPDGAQVKHIHQQTIGGRHFVVMWALVDSTRPLVSRTFRIYATGEEISVPVFRYIGTAHIDWTVWHVFEDAR